MQVCQCATNLGEWVEHKDDFEEVREQVVTVRQQNGNTVSAKRDEVKSVAKRKLRIKRKKYNRILSLDTTTLRVAADDEQNKTGRAEQQSNNNTVKVILS